MLVPSLGGQPQFAVAAHVNKVRLVKPLQLDEAMPQTPGVYRLAAVSHDLVGSEAIWAGVVLAEPATASSVHHHGSLESVMYVLSGQTKVRWGIKLEYEVELEAGDFLFVPPYMPHQEINPSPDRPTAWIVMRSGQESVLVPLERNPEGDYVVLDAAGSGRNDER